MELVHGEALRKFTIYNFQFTMKWMKRESVDSTGSPRRTAKRYSGFTLIELLVVVGIMIVLAVVGVSNFMFSLKKSHDVTRKSDLATIAKGLEAFASDWGDYPAGDASGKIVGCDVNKLGLVACSWGGSFATYFPQTAADPDKRLITFLTEIPNDPVSGQNYFYERVDLEDSLGNFIGHGFNLYALLENTADPNVKTGLLVSCGSANCNYQLSQSGVQ